MMMDREYALSLINNKILLHSILTFNLESKADKDKLPAKVASFFENYPQFMQGLNKNSFLLKPANFAAAEFLDFKDLKTRILLLDDADFEQILLYLGACVYAPYITKIVIKKDLACIQTALGKNVYDFVMQHGRYVVGTISLQEYALLEPEYIVDVTIKAGVALIDHYAKDLLSPYNELLYKRIEKFSVNEDYSTLNLNSEKVYSLIRFIAVNEINLKWKDLFA